MSEALGHALEQIWLRIEQGMHEAELELAEERELCVRLEGEIRSIRAVLERTAPEVDAAAAPAVARAPEPATATAHVPEPAPARPPVAAEAVGVPDEELRELAPEPPKEPATGESASGVITIPPAAPETETEADPEGATTPPDTDGDTAPDADGERAGYMPMLEELWEIARRDG